MTVLWVLWGRFSAFDFYQLFSRSPRFILSIKFNDLYLFKRQNIHLPLLNFHFTGNFQQQRTVPNPIINSFPNPKCKFLLSFFKMSQTVF